MAGDLYVEGGVKKDYTVPRELTEAEIKDIVAAWADAAERAVKVGGDVSSRDRGMT
jgi:N-ethylmaleimide reductase